MHSLKTEAANSHGVVAKANSQLRHPRRVVLLVPPRQLVDRRPALGHLEGVRSQPVLRVRPHSQPLLVILLGSVVELVPSPVLRERQLLGPAPVVAEEEAVRGGRPLAPAAVDRPVRVPLQLVGGLSVDLVPHLVVVVHRRSVLPTFFSKNFVQLA